MTYDEHPLLPQQGDARIGEYSQHPSSAEASPEERLVEDLAAWYRDSPALEHSLERVWKRLERQSTATLDERQARSKPLGRITNRLEALPNRQKAIPLVRSAASLRYTRRVVSLFSTIAAALMLLVVVVGMAATRGWLPWSTSTHPGVASVTRLQLIGNNDFPTFTVLTYTTQASGQYLLAITQDYFDGHAWTSRQQTTKTFEAGQSLDDTSADLKTVEQTVHLVHPSAGSPNQYLFAAAQPVSFSLPGTATQDAGGYTSWSVRGQLTTGQQYTARSALSTADAETLRQVPLPGAAQESTNPLYSYPPDVLKRYLQLPDDLQGEPGTGVRNLAQEWTRGTTTMYDMALALEENLRTRYTYTQHTDNPPSAQDAVAWFLLSEKAGFCTFFASAMVIMARMLGIPARVASGYTAGTFDEHSQQYVVKGTDAHTWAQLYFAGYGWINFEPSPGFPLYPVPAASATSTSAGVPA